MFASYPGSVVDGVGGVGGLALTRPTLTHVQKARPGYG